MNYLKSNLSVFALLFLSTFGFSQTNQISSLKEIKIKTDRLENSILWKVEHPDLTKSSYLLGTIHAMCEDDFYIPSKVLNVLDEVNEIAFEVNLSAPEEMANIQKAMLGDKKISEQISKEKQEILDAFLSEKLGMELAQVDHLKLVTLYSMIIGLSLDCTSNKSFEMELMNLVADKAVTISGMETVIEQFECLDKSYTPDDYIEQINNFDSYKVTFKKAFAYYQEENIEMVAELYIDDNYMHETARYWSLDYRNLNWVNKLPAKFKDNSILVAVGAAHLVGESGLIHQLRSKGYIITPVFK